VYEESNLLLHFQNIILLPLLSYIVCDLMADLIFLLSARLAPLKCLAHKQIDIAVI